MDANTKKLLGATATPLASIFGSGFLSACGLKFGFRILDCGLRKFVETVEAVYPRSQKSEIRDELST